MPKPSISGNTISIPSSQEHLNDVDVFVEGLLTGFGAEQSTVTDIAISVSELVNNAIFHGNKAVAEKLVTVKVAKIDGKVEISVTDQGGGFDPGKIESPVADANLLREVGRGIFIVRSLMDEVDFTPSDEGTTVTIRKAI